MKKTMDEMVKANFVSVPSRGSGFLNDYIAIAKENGFEFPSPLGEVGSLMQRRRTQMKRIVMFPSPLGEVGSLIKRIR